MIQWLPRGVLFDAPGAGMWAVCLAAVVFCLGGGWSLRGHPRKALLIVSGLVGGTLGAWGMDALLTGRATPVGLSLLGAVLFGPLAVAGVERAHGVKGADLIQALDRLSLPSLLAAVVARSGCLLAGCELGRPIDGGFSVRYAAGTAAFKTLVARGSIGPGAVLTPPMHPIPLYEIVGVVIVLVAVWLLQRKGASVAFVAGGGWMLSRGISELFRFERTDTVSSVSPLAGVVLLIGVCLLAAALIWRNSCLRRTRLGLPGSCSPDSSPVVPTTRVI